MAKIRFAHLARIRQGSLRAVVGVKEGQRESLRGQVTRGRVLMPLAAICGLRIICVSFRETNGRGLLMAP